MNIMIMQCAVVFCFLALGEFLVWLTGIKLPSSIVGLLLLTAALKMKLVKLRHVDLVSNFLLKNMGFFFVPPGVALMLYLDVIQAQLVPIVIASVLSTVLVIIVTGWVHQLMRRHHNHQSQK